jgi:hypothetical protein
MSPRSQAHVSTGKPLRQICRARRTGAFYVAPHASHSHPQRDARLILRRFGQRRAFSRARLCKVFCGCRRLHRERGRMLNTPRRGVCEEISKVVPVIKPIHALDSDDDQFTFRSDIPRAAALAGVNCINDVHTFIGADI